MVRPASLWEENLYKNFQQNYIEQERMAFHRDGSFLLINHKQCEILIHHLLIMNKY